MGDDAIYMADEPYKQTPLEHGDRGMYTKMKCRCMACTKANRDYQREYMRQRRMKQRAINVESYVEDDSNDDDSQLRF